MSVGRTISLCFLGALAGCGAAPSPTPTRRLDVFHDVYLRGAPSAAGRVALTFEGVTACTGPILAALKAPGPGLPPLRATFFLNPRSVAAAEAADPSANKALLARLAAEDHRVALSAAMTGDDATEQRLALGAASTALAGQLKAAGAQAAHSPRIWRPTLSTIALEAIGNTAEADRPAILWSLRAEPGHELAVLDRLADADIVALPGGGTGCPSVDLVPRLARALKAAGLQAVTVPELLEQQLERHRPARAVRYHGPGLSAECARALAVDPSPRTSPLRWGLVDAVTPNGVRLLPLGVSGSTTADLVAALPTVRRLWGRRGDWRGMPGCLREVLAPQLLSPVTPEALGGRTRWHTVGDGPRDARAAVAAGRALVVPTIHDLTRIEAVQRLPWITRGLVGGALGNLGLETPLLLESRGGIGLIIAKAIGPDDLGHLERAAEVVAGYTLLTEVSAAEYLLLATRFPKAASALKTAARASDGFLQVGPFLVIPAVSGGAPDATRLAVDGQLAFPAGALATLRDVLRGGVSLRPGDVVSVVPRGVSFAPEVDVDVSNAGSYRSATRHTLAQALRDGLRQAKYLRPGRTTRVEGDLLGQHQTRLAAPPGIAVPTQTVVPVIEPAKAGGPR